MKLLARRCVVVSFALLGCVPRGAQTPTDQSRWVASWEAAPQLVEPRNLPPTPGLAGSTLRQRIRVSLGGSRWRLRLSNEFGDGPLTVTAIRIARSAGADLIDSASSVAVKFDGRPSLAIPAGSASVSDAVDLVCASFCDFAVSLYVTSAPPAVTGHPGSRTTSYLLSGDHVGARGMAGAATPEHWYILSGVETVASRDAAAVVVLGNSIADGRGSTTNGNDRWPDNLARRLRENAGTANVGVLNAGIGGNTVLRGGLGPTAMTRLERDVLSQAGARWVIVSEGVNDIGGAQGADSSASVARQLVNAYSQIITRAHSRGLRVYGATILPFAGSQYGSADHEQARQTVNGWIRAPGNFDATIDLDAVMRDSTDGTRLRASVDGGDHLHPNAFGYRVMAGAIDLTLFTNSRR